MPDNNEQKILEIFRNNDQKGIAEIYKVYRNEFIAFANKKYSIGFEESKETYQQAFLILINNVKNGRLTELTSSLKTYLFQIGRNQINNELKRNARQTGIESQSGIQDSSLHDFDFDSFDEKEYKIKKVIKESFQKLSDTCRRLLSLFYFEKKRHEEIMTLMNYANIDSVKTQKYKCFKKLEMVVKSDYSLTDFFN